MAGRSEPVASFATAAAPGDQSYTVGTAIDTLTLPEAGGGDGSLTYELAPEVPGLNFDPATRQLTGTPTAAVTYDMTYTVTDEDGDTDTLKFHHCGESRSVRGRFPGRLLPGVTGRDRTELRVPGTTEEFSVNARGRGRFLADWPVSGSGSTTDDRRAGLRFPASHQGDGVWRIDRVAGSTEVPVTAAPDRAEPPLKGRARRGL